MIAACPYCWILKAAQKIERLGSKPDFLIRHLISIQITRRRGLPIKVSVALSWGSSGNKLKFYRITVSVKNLSSRLFDIGKFQIPEMVTLSTAVLASPWATMVALFIAVVTISLSYWTVPMGVRAAGLHGSF